MYKTGERKISAPVVDAVTLRNLTFAIIQVVDEARLEKIKNQGKTTKGRCLALRKSNINLPFFTNIITRCKMGICLKHKTLPGSQTQISVCFPQRRALSNNQTV